MIKKLNDICSFVSGNAWKSSEFADEGIPIIRINNLNTNDNDFKYWQGDYDKKYLIYEGDLLVSLSGTIKTFQWNGPEALLNQRIVKVTANPDTNQDWVYYQISHVIEQIANKGKHAVIKNVSINDLKNFEVDVPDFQTQNKIVAILDKASALVQKRQQTIDLLDELLRAQFLEMFGMKNPDFQKWDEIEIQDLAKGNKGSMRTGPFGSSLKHDEFTEEGEVAVLGIDNAVNNVFKWDKRRYITKVRYEESFKRYTVFPRDVIITIMGTVGRSAVIPDDIPLSINTKHLACITLDETKCNPYYLAYSIHSNPFTAFQMKARNRGAIMEGLNLGIIKTLKLKNAPISLQNRFEKIYFSITERKNSLKQSASKIEDLLNALLQRAFTGKLNLDLSIELDALLEEIDLQKSENDLFSIITNEEYLLSLINRLNNQEFESQDLYDKAKQVAFQLLKEEERLAQEFDEQSQSLKLVVK
ncbi:Type I restriction-modification system, specificity subunit S [Fulvivirga imtechensis AK7]|uniref:Type I restriction-modification system, specificity subunit S n=1 Tax=Fulvivirga imtechensis AK7 TaxID=1237149 RepID=L8JK98_9BACT|nr:restriction endonuclease subunit S [Fulvivirga imtechensis]ELR69321.1 Type I restriction-modification system, specificity subunit S [Fulvivirga imtechensis AK7]